MRFLVLITKFFCNDLFTIAFALSLNPIHCDLHQQKFFLSLHFQQLYHNITPRRVFHFMWNAKVQLHAKLALLLNCYDNIEKNAIKVNWIVMFWNNDYGLFVFHSLFSVSKAILSFCENQFQIIRINGGKSVKRKVGNNRNTFTFKSFIAFHKDALLFFPTSRLVHKHLHSEVGHSSSSQ